MEKAHGKKTENANKPVHEVVIPFAGSVLKAAIWRNQTDGKSARYSVSVARSYRIEGSESWSHSEYFSRDEIIGLSRVLEAAHVWIVNATKKETKK